MSKTIGLPEDLIHEGTLDAIRLWAWCKRFTERSSNQWPGDETAADELNISRDDVESALQELEDCGFIECDRATGLFKLKYGG